MSVDIFTKEQFEEILPSSVDWYCLGLIDGEYVYRLPIIKDEIEIELRSSIDGSGYSADTGQDSIRAWLVGANNKPLGSKVSKWTTRLPGWSNRLLHVLRKLWQMAQFAGYCEDCKVPRGVYKVQKNGRNKNKIFAKCNKCNNHFEWMEE